MAEERRKSDPANNCRARWRLNLNLFFKTAHLAKNPNA
jgi:hypothetical protein